MATKTLVQYVSDLSGAELAENEVHTVQWEWAGKRLELDLSPEEAEEFEADMAKWGEPARFVKNGHGAVTKLRSARSSAPRNEKSAEIREWAQANGYEVSARGRIAKEIVQAYEATH